MNSVMEAWEIGGLVLLLLLIIGCFVYCFKFVRRWNRASAATSGQTTLHHRKSGSDESSNRRTRRSAWDADDDDEDDDDDAWNAEVGREEVTPKSDVRWDLSTTGKKTKNSNDANDKGIGAKRMDEYLERTDNDADRKNGDDCTIYGATTLFSATSTFPSSATASSNSVKNNWIIHFDND